jgi:Protein of unknown function (DUF4038)/Domain of unknown function (DUF5060)/Putative collagen-binding domain of a collagenase
VLVEAEAAPGRRQASLHLRDFSTAQDLVTDQCSGKRCKLDIAANLCSLARFVFLIAFLFVGCSKKGPNFVSSDKSNQRQEQVTASRSAATIDCYDFFQLTLQVDQPVAKNPFRDVNVSARFSSVEQGEQFLVDGFCDDPNGTIFRVRFMPCKPGNYTYSVTYRRDHFEYECEGTFKARDGKRRGILRVDANYPWHFVWEGSREHFFLNGTTAFLLMGWTNERVIRDCIDRLCRLDVNRIRVLLDGRMHDFLTEPIRPGGGFYARLNPWVAKRPNNVRNPKFNYGRFHCTYWQKFERMLDYAREKGLNVSVIFGWNDTKVHPVAGSEDECRYFRYAVSRLAAYANVTWDLGDDLDRFRSEAWTHDTGTMLYSLDPYHHLATSHPVDNRYQDRTSQWFSMTSFQRWDRPLHRWMLDQREQQLRTKRIIPQINEEYGYEDHYPAFAPYRPPAASADANRRAAWEVVMAGCYQTTGETAKRGTGVAPGTGGGWVNGRGDETMTMLKGYAHMVHFFTSFEWWKTEPHDELVNNGAYCLAEPGQLYVVYLPRGGNVSVKLDPGRYQAKLFNPRSGEYSSAPMAENAAWSSPVAPDGEDWVFLLSRI